VLCKGMIHAMRNGVLAVDKGAVAIKNHKSKRISGHVGSFIKNLERGD